jgi:virginiamycin A acetyltransferase
MYVERLDGGKMSSATLRRIFYDYHKIEIGKYSYGGCFDHTRIGEFTRIGRYCSFAEGVCIFNGNHPLEFKSTHPFFYNTAFGYVEEEMIDRNRLVIGNDVWIGRNALILPFVKFIGDGSVIGAGAIVTKNVPDFAVVAGNPATIIKYRFTKETAEEIKDSKWWDKDMELLEGQLTEFLRPLEAKGQEVN